jgi:hypothetical protein
MTRRRLARPRRTIALIGVAALIYGVTSMDELAGATPPASDSTETASAADPPAAPTAGPTPLVEIGPTPADRDIRFELVLAFPGREAMQHYALSVGDPASAAVNVYFLGRFAGAPELLKASVPR